MLPQILALNEKISTRNILLIRKEAKFIRITENGNS